MVGSTGPIVEDRTFGFQPPGYYDSHGVPVTTGGTTSLYEAQMNDARDVRDFHWNGGNGTWSDPSGWLEQLAPGDVYAIALRDYLIGDIDQYAYDGPGSVDEAYIDPSWHSYIQGVSPDPITGFDDLAGNQNVAFTIQHQLDTGERVVHGSVAFGLREGIGQAGTDFVRLFDGDPSHQFDFSSLGWDTELNSSATFVGVVDLGSYLDELQTGSVNVQINDDTGADWAIYTVAVATPIADPVGPAVFIESGGDVVVDSVVGPVASLSMQGSTPSTLTLQSDGKVNVNGELTLGGFSNLAVELAGTAMGEFGAIATLGDATVDGILEVQPTSEFNPVAGDSFAFIDVAGTLAGEFTGLSEGALVGNFGGTNLFITYSGGDGNDVVLFTVKLAGDYNNDSTVDAEDYTVWQDNMGLDSSILNGNGSGAATVVQADYLLWKTNFGQSSASGSANSVPEPATLLLALLSLVAMPLRVRCG